MNCGGISIASGSMACSATNLFTSGAFCAVERGGGTGDEEAQPSGHRGGSEIGEGPNCGINSARVGEAKRIEPRSCLATKVDGPEVSVAGGSASLTQRLAAVPGGFLFHGSSVSRPGAGGDGESPACSRTRVRRLRGPDSARMERLARRHSSAGVAAFSSGCGSISLTIFDVLKASKAAIATRYVRCHIRLASRRMPSVLSGTRRRSQCSVANVEEGNP